MIQTEVLVLGCGIAGATAALRLARDPDRRIIVITRDPDPRESNTRYAQGGIVARGPDDSHAALEADILAAGAGAVSGSSPNAGTRGSDGHCSHFRHRAAGRAGAQPARAAAIAGAPITGGPRVGRFCRFLSRSRAST